MRWTSTDSGYLLMSLFSKSCPGCRRIATAPGETAIQCWKHKMELYIGWPASNIQRVLFLMHLTSMKKNSNGRHATPFSPPHDASDEAFSFSVTIWRSIKHLGSFDRLWCPSSTITTKMLHLTSTSHHCITGQHPKWVSNWQDLKIQQGLRSLQSTNPFSWFTPPKKKKLEEFDPKFPWIEASILPSGSGPPRPRNETRCAQQQQFAKRILPGSELCPFFVVPWWFLQWTDPWSVVLKKKMISG